MRDHLEYKGYTGSADVDPESGTAHGRLLFIRDVIGYSADSVAQLPARFREAVDEYLDFCRRQGVEPEPPRKPTSSSQHGQVREN